MIIVDSFDPVGPAETLFAPAFYDSMKAALAPNGIVCTQGEAGFASYSEGRDRCRATLR